MVESGPATEMLRSEEPSLSERPSQESPPRPPPPLTVLPRARIGHPVGSDVESSVRADQALLLRIQGFTYAEIASRCRYSARRSAQRAVQRAAARAGVSADDREAWRDLTITRYEHMIGELWPAVQCGDAKAINVVRGVVDSEVRLLGLESPSVSIVGNVEIDQMIESRLAYLRELEREAGRKAIRGNGSGPCRGCRRG